MEFTADQVWGCAAAAHRINGGYVKEPVWSYPVDGQPVLSRDSNKNMVKRWLREQDFSQITAADYDAGNTYRNHFKTYTLLALKGTLNDFQSTAMRIAAKDQFTGRDLYDFAVVACLPSVSERDQAHTEFKRDLYHSEPLEGTPGDVITCDMVTISCRWNANYGKYRITGRINDSFVDFYHSTEFEGTVRIKAKIKQQRGDKTTQLNYVKKI